MSTSGTPRSATYRANWFQGRRALGGSLEVDRSWLRFTPHLLDRMLGGGNLELAARDVRSTSVLKAFPRDRVLVTLRSGEVEVFLVSRPEERAREIASILGVTFG